MMFFIGITVGGIIGFVVGVILSDSSAADDYAEKVFKEKWQED